MGRSTLNPKSGEVTTLSTKKGGGEHPKPYKCQGDNFIKTAGLSTQNPKSEEVSTLNPKSEESSTLNPKSGWGRIL